MQSLSVYPVVKGLVPLAMFVCGVAMLPKAHLFAAFSRVMPRASSKHFWLARSLGLPARFLITFFYRATGPAGLGFLGYAFIFLGQAVLPISPALGHFLLSHIGHLLSGLAGFPDTAGHVCGSRSDVAKVQFTPPAETAPASLFHFISVTSLFVFAYAGLGAGPALGGEVRQHQHRMLPPKFSRVLIRPAPASVRFATPVAFSCPGLPRLGLAKAGPQVRLTADDEPNNLLMSVTFCPTSFDDD